MKKLILLALLVPSLVYAQNWHVNIFGGFSNYSGDLQNKPFTLDQSFFAFGASAQYDLTPHFSLLSGFNIGHIGAADRFNKPELQIRNLSFQTQIFEWNVMAEYNLLDLSEKRFTPYVFAGLAIFHFDPYAIDTLGNKIFLRPLSTEGEGLSAYPDRKPYSSCSARAIPFGGGIKLRVTNNVTIAYEISFRKLFTDYLDDVSSTYVDQATLLAARGAKAVEMAYRGGEIKGGSTAYPAGGTQRGGVKQQDLYYFTGIRISIGINGGNSEEASKSKLGCPKMVY